jgi:GAF domain-containing protein
MISPSSDRLALLGAIAQMAHQTVPLARAVTVTVVTADGACTVVSTSDWAGALDRAQYTAAGGGPSVDAAVAGTVREMADAAVETRWPGFVAAALAQGARSSTSIPIPVDDGVVASLNAFALMPRAFTDADTSGLTRLAGIAAAALTNADPDTGPGRMRAVVDQARGIVMHEEQCNQTEALDRMSQRAADAGQALRELAIAVVERTASRPAT